MWQWKPLKEGIRGALFPELTGHILCCLALMWMKEIARIGRSKVWNRHRRQGTDFTPECLRFAPPFCLPLLIALEQQGRVQVKLSLKSDHDQPFQLAGEGNSMGTCSVSSLTELCPELPHTLVCLVWHCIHINLLQSLWPWPKPSMGIFSEAGPFSFGHVDTSGEILCSLVMAGNNASDARAPCCVWCCSCWNHDVPDCDTHGRSQPLSLDVFSARDHCWGAQWNSSHNSWDIRYPPVLPVVAKHGTWSCWPGLTGSHTATDFSKLLLGWTLLSFTQQVWVVHIPSCKGL